MSPIHPVEALHLPEAPYETYPVNGIVYPCFFSRIPQGLFEAYLPPNLYLQPPYATQPLSVPTWGVIPKSSTETIPLLVNDVLPFSPPREVPPPESPLREAPPREVPLRQGSFLEWVEAWAKPHLDLGRTHFPLEKKEVNRLVSHLRSYKTAFKRQFAENPEIGPKIADILKKVLLPYDSAKRIEQINVLLDIDLDPLHLSERLEVLCDHWEGFSKSKREKLLKEEMSPLFKHLIKLLNNRKLKRDIVSRVFLLIRIVDPSRFPAIGCSSQLPARFFSDSLSYLKKVLKKHKEPFSKKINKKIMYMLESFALQGRLEETKAHLSEEFIEKFYSRLRDKRVSFLIP